MSSTFANQLLIAMPNLKGAPFEESVIYICQHDQNGAMGLVLTYPIKPRLSDLFTQLEITLPKNTDIIENMPLYLGGPVEPEHGFILHSHHDKPLQSTIQISSELFITTSKDILIAIAEDEGPDNSLVTLGYAGWNAGQLEQEIQEGSWLNAPPNCNIIFDEDPKQKWAEALKSIGIKDVSKLAGFSGQA